MAKKQKQMHLQVISASFAIVYWPIITLGREAEQDKKKERDIPHTQTET